MADSSYESVLEQCIEWIQRYTVKQQGISVTSKQQIPYPEVSGYFIPSLLDWDMNHWAEQYADWLVSIQNKNGSWSDPAGVAPYLFDTGQILKGLLAMIDTCPHYEAPIRKACDWIAKQILSTGKIKTGDKKHLYLSNGQMVPEAIHLYALSPLNAAAEKWKVPAYRTAVQRAVKYYTRNPSLVSFQTLSHFHAYIIEALVDLGVLDLAKKGMEEIAGYQRSNGAIPAYRDVVWICSTGLFQYALIWYKLGDRERADLTFNYACSLQNKSGGFYGGYGRYADYFPNEEISWAVKYFLDAYRWKKHGGEPTDENRRSTSDLQPDGAIYH